MLYIGCYILLSGCSQRQDRNSQQFTISKEANPLESDREAWRRIHTWISANAPKINANLNPAADGKQLLATQQSLASSLPSQWQDLYRTHDGMNSRSNLGSLFFGMQFLTLSEAVLEHSNSNLDGIEPFSVRAADSGIRTHDMHNPKWIAFARSGETLLCVDLDPAPSGNLGQVIFVDHDDNTVILIADSINSLLLQFASDLENGRYFLNKDAQAEGDEFLQCVPEIDVINWHKSPKWKHLTY